MEPVISKLLQAARIFLVDLFGSINSMFYLEIQRVSLVGIMGHKTELRKIVGNHSKGIWSIFRELLVDFIQECLVDFENFLTVFL